MIHQSFQSWDESPISTNVDTLPISELKFPKVTVCPPKNSFTNLNYDLEIIGNKSVNGDLRDELIKFAFDEVHDPYFRSMMANLSLFHEENRFYNWYHGYTKINCPWYVVDNSEPFFSQFYLYYNFFTTLPSGSFSTPFFGSKFNKKKVINTKSTINIYVPYSVAHGEKDFILFSKKNYTGDSGLFLFEVNNFTRDYMKSPNYGYTNYFSHEDYDVSYYDRQHLEVMPGFKLDWSFNVVVPLIDGFSEEKITQLYVRYISILLCREDKLGK